MTKWIVVREVFGKRQYMTRHGFFVEDPNQAHTFRYKKDAMFHAKHDPNQRTAPPKVEKETEVNLQLSNEELRLLHSAWFNRCVKLTASGDYPEKIRDAILLRKLSDALLKESK